MPAEADDLLFAEHVEVGQMGEHVREVRFASPVLLRRVQILGRNEKPHPGSTFEGITFPNVLAMSLNIYATDKAAGSSTMPRLLPLPGTPGAFGPTGEELLTDCLVCRGEFLRLSIAIFGRRSGQDFPTAAVDPVDALPAYLRPSSAFDPDRLDLAPCDVSEDGPGGGAAAVDAVAAEAADSGAPSSLARALTLSIAADANTRIVSHGTWVSSLVEDPDVLEADAVVARLESLVQDFATLAHSAPDSSAAHASPVVARRLLDLISRCVSRLEFRPLRAALRALAASLCLAPTAAEVLRKGGLAKLLGILRDSDWCQLGHKLAALQAMLQLCTHAVGMEALLGWSIAQEASTGVTLKAGVSGSGLPDHVTGYDLILAMVADGAEGGTSGLHSELEPIALTLLRRAAFYAALARLDSNCTRLAEGAGAGTDSAVIDSNDGALRGVADALADVAVQLEKLSAPDAVSSTGGGDLCGEPWPSGPLGSDLIDEEDPLGRGPAALLLLLPGGGKGATSEDQEAGSDPFQRAHPKLHGFIESFMTGRRLLPNLNTILKRMPKLKASDRLAIFVPLRRLLLALLACTGGARFLTLDAQACNTLVGLLDVGSGGKGAADSVGLPAIPSYPGALAKASIGASQLAALVSLHVRATRLVLLAVARTRQKGNDGLLPESDALPLLSALHQLCARGSAGAASVVCAFRSVFLVEWLLRQLEGRLDDAGGATAGAGSAAPPQPSIRHLVAILYTLVLRDTTACVAERFGARVLSLAVRSLELLEGAGSGDGGDAPGWGRAPSSLEFALDSDEGSLGKAVRVGRRGADLAFLTQLRELVAQLRPWQQPAADGEQAADVGIAAEAVSTSKLMTCARLPTAPPRGLKRSSQEDRSHQLALLLGGYAAADLAVEVAEVDFVGEDGDDERKLSDERRPSGNLAELPLLAVRLLCRRARENVREALAIELSEDRSTARGGQARDGLATLVPIFVRCAAALGLNLEAVVAQQEETDTVDAIYESQQVHGYVLEAALQTCYHVLLGLKEAGVHYRHAELLHSLHLLVDRLLASLAGLLSGPEGSDPEFRLLWRHCLVWVCRVFRAWVQLDPGAAGGQLLQPLLRHTRVLPMHFAPGLVLLATCGSLEPILPAVSHSFSISPGKVVAEAPVGEQHLASRPLLFPVSTRGGATGHVALRAATGNAAADTGKALNRKQNWGQLWDMDCEEGVWDVPEADASAEAAAAAAMAHGTKDPLVMDLKRKPQTAAVAAALDLVDRVSARRERFLMDDLGEIVALVTQCAVTSSALLHHLVVRVMEKLTIVGVPVLAAVLQLAQTVLQGDRAADVPAGSPESNDRGDVAATWAPEFTSGGSGGARNDQRDARAVLRLLLLFRHFGERSPATRRALVEARVDTFCLAVLAHDPAPLPPAALTQAVHVLGLILCPSPGLGGDSSAGSLSVPKRRMATKALSLVVNRSSTDDGQTPVGSSAVAAVLELLVRLSSVKSTCLNLLFSPDEEVLLDAGAEDQVPVTVSCAFRLASVTQRVATELSMADEDWDASQPGSEAEADTEEILAAWLRAAALLVELCQSVVGCCPTRAVFLAVFAPGASIDSADDSQMSNVLADVREALNYITQRKRSEAIKARATAVLDKLMALQAALLELKQGPAPKVLPRDDFCVTSSETATPDRAVEASTAAVAEDDLLTDMVALFEAVDDMERNPDWAIAAELDPAQPSAKAQWAFDAAAHRKKRQDALEKLESDRQAKRLKLAPQLQPPPQQPRKRSREREKAPEAAARPTAPAMSPPATPPPTATASLAAAVSQAVVPATAASAAPAAPAGVAAKAAAKPGPAEALQSFMKDHPEFMRVLKNPQKVLSDPRVKSMFVAELQNYPEVRAFFESKGLKLD
eukprot:TRINITY_DN8249_c0_g4_i1.p1 TRINITY_DN8249_c0_g4~~TRINITY_DN8249_c0_g4_i1.p1  ORF type:complete len:1883 (-),score=387.78 TRINITY_DN8249_c0_g4_i1:67-5715(-)